MGYCMIASSFIVIISHSCLKSLNSGAWLCRTFAARSERGTRVRGNGMGSLAEPQ